MPDWEEVCIAHRIHAAMNDFGNYYLWMQVKNRTLLPDFRHAIHRMAAHPLTRQMADEQMELSLKLLTQIAAMFRGIAAVKNTRIVDHFRTQLAHTSLVHSLDLQHQISTVLLSSGVD